MIAMMKSPIILVACTLLFSSLVVLASQSGYSPSECCFRFRNTMLPKKNIVSYKYTNMMCPMQGVLFIMKNEAEICVDPSKEWVRNFIESRDKNLAKKGNNTEPSD